MSFNPPSKPSENPQKQDPLFFRRTAIPILLTTGVVLCAAGAFILAAGPDSAIQDVAQKPAAIVLLVLGAILIALGVLNMLSVRHALRYLGPR
jgi:uncharacterized membrane protein YidH (DUF202 family)